jgi:signal transduction histidine kinase/CheY-like chemotaxis protein
MPAFLQELLSRLGYVFFEHGAKGEFRLLSPAPQWLAHLWSISGEIHSSIPVTEKSPFLEYFLCEADALLGVDANATCQSEAWVESSPAGKEIPLQALALQVDGKRYLALQSPESQFKEHSRLLQTARNANLEHEKLLREIQKKEILLHCIIHDLSQPLSVMSVALDCLSDEPVSERAHGFLELGKRAGDQQLSMIRDILQVFSADLKESLDARAVADYATDILQSAKFVVSTYTPVFAASGVLLRFTDPVDEIANWRIRGEAKRLQRVFSNLLENALRYTPASACVTIALEREGEFIRVLVDDEGPGLPADLSPSQIFALFSKGKTQGGKAGLGLYFCRLTVERWGGSIGCESRPERGARFWFRLPIVVSQKNTALTGKVRANSTQKRLFTRKGPMRILLADDQNEIRLLTTHQLERGGHHVVTVANGKEVLEALQRETFDVILLDEQMPELNGIETLHAIRADGKQPVQPVIIALTGFNTDDDRDRLLGAGFDGVIGKPFRMDFLEGLLTGSTETEAPGASGQAQGVAQEGTPPDLLQRVGGDTKLLRQMIRTFLRDTPKRLTEIGNAIRQRQGDKLKSYAHALKGPVSIFGADKARLSCLELEQAGHIGDFSACPRMFETLQEEIAQLEANLRGYAGQKGRPQPGIGSNSKIRGSAPARKSH